MNKFSVVFLLTLITANVYVVNSSEYECKGLDTPIVNSKRVNSEDEKLTERQMKITYEIIKTNSSTFNQTFNEWVTKELDLNVKFFSDLLTIRPRYSDDMIFDTCCPGFQFKGNNKQYDSDLHIFVEINTQQDYIPNNENDNTIITEPCKVVNKVGVTHGYIFIDQSQFKNQSSLYLNLRIQQQFLYLLGFYIAQISEFNSTNLTYEIMEMRDKQFVIATSPEIKQFVHEDIGCKQLNGFPLDNINQHQKNKTNISLRGYWSSILITQNLPNSKLNPNIFSLLDIAYLKGTGFYTKVNDMMAHEIYKNKGCSIFDFVLKIKLCPNEFRLSNIDGEEYGYQNPICSFYEFIPSCTIYADNKYYSHHQNRVESQQFNKKCFFLKNHTITTDESLKGIPADQIQQYHIDPHYLASSCDGNNKVQVSFQDKDYDCLKDKEEIEINKNATLICPDRLSEFCAKQL